MLVRGALPSSVVILFVVSGFVVYPPTVATGGRFGSVGAYAIRRGARILPAYRLALGVALILLATVGNSPGIRARARSSPTSPSSSRPRRCSSPRTSRSGSG